MLTVRPKRVVLLAVAAPETLAVRRGQLVLRGGTTPAKHSAATCLCQSGGRSPLTAYLRAQQDTPGSAHGLSQCVLHLRACTERGVLPEQRLFPGVYLVLEGPHEVSPEGFQHPEHAFVAMRDVFLPQREWRT